MDTLIIPEGIALTVVTKEVDKSETFTSISPELAEIVKGNSELAMRVLTTLPVEGISRGEGMFKNVNLTPDFLGTDLEVVKTLWKSDNHYEIKA